MRIFRTKTHFLITAIIFLSFRGSAGGSATYRLSGHLPLKQIVKSRHLGRFASDTQMPVAFALKPRDPEGLHELISRIYDPNSPDFGRYLSPENFRQRFAPSDYDVQIVIEELQSRGLRIKQVHENKLLIDAEAPAGVIEAAFQTEIHEYVSPDGRRVFSPHHDPAVGYTLQSRLNAVVGLDNFQRYRNHAAGSDTHSPMARQPISNPDRYMTPQKIKSAYALSTAPTVGSGEVVALFQLDGYDKNDIAKYAQHFSITAPPLQDVWVDGFNGSIGENTDEVALDIELVMAVSPGLSKIMVYSGPNTDLGVLHTYQRIANDNEAKVVSSSWGAPEDRSSFAFRNAENVIFQQMAAQGQSVFVASGDRGAYDDIDRPTELEVNDPASQPFVTAVGGTTLSLSGTSNYLSETSWGTSNYGGGGGISTSWSQPSWQSGLGTNTNNGSTRARMVPDVSLNANPSVGYAIYTRGSWWPYGGTSAAAPLWAAFAAQVNQARSAKGLPRLGFANPSLYQLGQSSLYGSSFNDIADNSTNRFYPAVQGYDLSTGWGSIRGPGLLAALSASELPPYPPASVNVVSGHDSVDLSWSSASGATSYSVLRSSSSNGPFTPIAENLASLSYSDSVSSGSYFYYVIASNTAGSSGPSKKKAGAPNLLPPSAPAALTATVVK